MADVMYLQPIDTSTSSFSSSATIRRHGGMQRSNESLWSSFLANGLSRRPTLPSNNQSASQRDDRDAATDGTSRQESFKSAYSRQRSSVTPQSAAATEKLAVEPINTSDGDTEQPRGDPPGCASKFESNGILLEDYENALKELEDDAPGGNKQPTAFRRWLSTLRRRKQIPLPTTIPSKHRHPLDDFGNWPIENSCFQSRKSHEKTGSWTSSSGIIATMKSATVTIASASIAPLSRRASKLRHRELHSSTINGRDTRPSIDSQRQMIDQAARQRSRKRRDKIEELIRSEESYVSDIKALCNVCGLS